ncbi:hypothetical protein FB451DRAFT_1400599 [Mycena latifolia]|nr:hypothetical protein FB451DRAFT_1400599 [Mycena latifolia]
MEVALQLPLRCVVGRPAVAQPLQSLSFNFSSAYYIYWEPSVRFFTNLTLRSHLPRRTPVACFLFSSLHEQERRIWSIHLCTAAYLYTFKLLVGLTRALAPLLAPPDPSGAL